MKNMDYVLDVKNLSTSFISDRKEIRIVKNVSLRLRRGTTLAVVGIVLNTIDLKRFDKVSLALYALMGWLVVVAMKAIIATLPPLGLGLLTAGGVAYTAGIVFYKSQGKYMHFVWHLFVLAGSVLQFFCIALYCLP